MTRKMLGKLAVLCSVPVCILFAERAMKRLYVKTPPRASVAWSPDEWSGGGCEL